jgi:hypothetical protein
MTGALKTPHCLLGQRSVPPVGRAWVSAGRSQIALQLADRRGTARHVSGPGVQDRLGRDQRRQRQRAGDPITVQALRALEADHRSLGERSVAAIDPTW